jgi:hypothetical protein
MLCGQSVSGIVVAVSCILKEFQYVQRDISFSLFSFKFTHFLKKFQGRIEIKLKFIWLSEQLG